MYIIDKLEIVNKAAKCSSAEFILANYLLKHLSALEQLNLKKIALETGLSKASIIRFCQNAGYDGFTVFMDSLSMERDALFDILNSHDEPDDEEAGKNFFKQYHQSAWYEQLMAALHKSQSVLFYGHHEYISCFHMLASYLFMQKKNVIDSMCWHIDNQKALFHQLTEDDLMIILEPQMSWRSYKELLTIMPETLHSLSTTSAKIAFIGQGTNDDIDFSISVPYTTQSLLYKTLFMRMDMKLTADLRKRGGMK